MSGAIIETFHVERNGVYFRQFADGSVEIGREENKTYTVFGTLTKQEWENLSKKFVFVEKPVKRATKK